MVRKSRIINLFKKIFSGIIGSGIFLLFAIFFFFIITTIYNIINKYNIIDKQLELSKLSIIIILTIFILAGFFYGIRSFIRKNTYRKILKPNWINISLTIFISILFSILIHFVFRNRFGIIIGYKSIIFLFLLFTVCFYLFCAVLINYLIPKRKRIKEHKIKNILILIVFNPLFVIVYIWFFLIAIYNSIYFPCGVEIVGIEKNHYTSNTINLGISSGEKIITIDGVKINSLQDINKYMSSLESTKQVVLETDKRIYYVRTYKMGEKRYMGLFLRQEYCVRE